MIRLGAAVVLVGIAASAFAFPLGSIIGVSIAGIVLGGGQGLAWAFMSQRILGSLSEDDRAIGAAGITTVRLTGSAAGAAVAAAAANLVGVSHGLTPAVAHAAGFWVFATVAPVAAGGLLAAWRLGGFPAPLEPARLAEPVAESA
jgi:hypothetical protein